MIKALTYLFLFTLPMTVSADMDDSSCEGSLSPIFYSYKRSERDPNKSLLLSDRFYPGQEIFLQADLVKRDKGSKSVFIETVQKRIETRNRASFTPWLHQLTNELLECSKGEGPPPCQKGIETGAVIVEYTNGRRCIGRVYGTEHWINAEQVFQQLHKCLKRPTDSPWTGLNWKGIGQIITVHTHPESDGKNIIAFHSRSDLSSDRRLYNQIISNSPFIPYRSLVLPMGINEALAFEAVYSR